MSASITGVSACSQRFAHDPPEYDYIFHRSERCGQEYAPFDHEPAGQSDTGTVKLDGKDVNAYSTNEIAKRIATLRQTNQSICGSPSRSWSRSAASPTRRDG